MNEPVIEALKKIQNSIGVIYWVCGNSFNSIEECLASINFNSCNDGLYVPKACRIKGLSGFYMVNKDGSIFFESRIIKESENKYVIENLSSAGYKEFEKILSQEIC